MPSATSDPDRRRRLRTAIAIAGLATAPLAAADSPSAAEALLVATDLFARAPQELRLRLEVGAEGSERATALEIYRRGAERALVRMLDARDRGKFVLRRGDETWFLAPGARPVRLAPSYRLHGGAALDELLGLSLARDYRIAAYEETSGVGTFDLEAAASVAPHPRVRWAVDVARRLPLRAELRSRDGRALRVLELRGWLDPRALVPGEVAVADLVRRGPKLVARFLEVDAAPLPDALFELDGGAARAALPDVPGAPVN